MFGIAICIIPILDNRVTFKSALLFQTAVLDLVTGIRIPDSSAFMFLRPEPGLQYSIGQTNLSQHWYTRHFYSLTIFSKIIMFTG